MGNTLFLADKLLACAVPKQYTRELLTKLKRHERQHIRRSLSWLGPAGSLSWAPACVPPSSGRGTSSWRKLSSSKVAVMHILGPFGSIWKMYLRDPSSLFVNLFLRSPFCYVHFHLATHKTQQFGKQTPLFLETMSKWFDWFPYTVIISTPCRRQGCGDEGGNGPSPLCSKLPLCLCNSSVNAARAGHQGDQGEPITELCGHRLNQLEDLASHSANQFLLCAFPASDTGEWDLKHFLFMIFILQIVNIVQHLPGHQSQPII